MSDDVVIYGMLFCYLLFGTKGLRNRITDIYINLIMFDSARICNKSIGKVVMQR